MSIESAPRLGRQGLPRSLLELCERLSAAGHRTWLVGGSVRDSLRAQLEGGSAAPSWTTKDWDVATDAKPEQVMRVFRRVIPTGIEHGTVTVVFPDLQIEVTTLRAEFGYADGRRPDQIGFVSDIAEDLARRDFTVNAIAFEPLSEQLFDPFGGVADLRARRLRAVGDASGRFAEDGLRVLRAARFVATLGFELDPETARAIRPSLDTYRKVSAERIRDEWNKALGARQPSRAFVIMQEHGLLEITAPELAALSEQSTESGSRLAQAFRHLDRCSARMELRLAALLAEIAPDPRSSAAAADGLLARLRYSNAERKLITRLIQHHELPLAESLSDAELRHWLRRVGPDLVVDLCSVARARLPDPNGGSALSAFEARAEAALALKPVLSLSGLAIDGNRLIAEAGVERGRAVGTTLEALLVRVIDDPTLNTPERLLDEARCIASVRNSSASR
jgi:tRNA nucleotidyltransferase (CCA-adding enzyme)